MAKTIRRTYTFTNCIGTRLSADGTRMVPFHDTLVYETSARAATKTFRRLYRDTSITVVTVEHETVVCWMPRGEFIEKAWRRYEDGRVEHGTDVYYGGEFNA